MSISKFSLKDLSDNDLIEEIKKMETISDHNNIAALIVKLFKDELNTRDNANND